MTRDRYSKMTTAALVAEFETICVAQYNSIEREETAKFNRQFKRMVAILDELKSRPGDQRRALQVLFGHDSLQVRYMAADANLAVDYEKARRELEVIAATKWYPQAAEAGMTLQYLDSGFYRPT